MSGLRVRDVFLSSNDFDPRQAVEPYPMSGEERVWKRKLSGDDFRYENLLVYHNTGFSIRAVFV